MSTFNDEIRRVTQDLKALADHVRLKVHLAGMDLKDEWSKLEPRLKAFERKVEDSADEVVTSMEQELRTLGQDLKAGLETLRSRLG